MGGGGLAPSQIHGGEFCGPPWILCGIRRQSPQCVLLVCEKFAENPEFRVGNFVVNLKGEISHAKLKCHEIPPPPLYFAWEIAGGERFATLANPKAYTAHEQWGTHSTITAPRPPPCTSNQCSGHWPSGVQAEESVRALRTSRA